MQITIPMRARLYLMGLIANEQGGLEDEKRVLSTELLYKIEVPQDEIGIYEMSLPQGGAYLHLDRIAQAPMLVVDLTGPELRRAITLLTEWKGYRPGDDRFIRPLLQDLRTASEDRPVGYLPVDTPNPTKKGKQANGGHL